MLESQSENVGTVKLQEITLPVQIIIFFSYNCFHPIVLEP